MNNNRNLTRGYLIALTGTIIWSFTGVLIRYVSVQFQLEPFVLAFWRDVFVFLILFLVFLVFKRSLLRISTPEIGFLLAFGLALSALNALWTISVALNGAGVSTVLIYSSPAYTAVLAYFLFREQLNLAKILAIVISLIGCVLVSGAARASSWELNLLGLLTGLASGVAFSVYSLFGKEAAKRGINSWTALLYTFFTAAILLLIYNQFHVWLPEGVASRNVFALGSNWSGWALLLLLALGPTIGGYGLYTLSMNYLPASVANLIATLEPAFTIAIAYFLLDEKLSTAQLLGSILIISAVLLLRLSSGRQQAAVPAV
jgi:drug/metabolite transporter (DMT)-like permease